MSDVRELSIEELEKEITLQESNLEGLRDEYLKKTGHLPPRDVKDEGYKWTIFMALGFAFISMIVFLLGIRIKKEDSLNIAVSIVTILLMLGGYAFIFLQLNEPLRWTVINAIDRLFLHLWPSFIFVFFMIVRTPEEFMKRVNE